MDVKYLKSVLRYILTAAVSLLLIVYLFYQARAAKGTFPSTSIALNREITVSEDVSGYLFLNESIVESSDSGAFLPLQRDGALVYPGQLLCSVYSAGQSEKINEIREIDSKIALLEDAQTIKGGLLDSTNYDTALKNKFSLLVNCSETGKLSLAQSAADGWFIAKSRRNISVKLITGYSAAISALENERSRLLSELSGGQNIYSGLSGNYYSYVDGYEEYFLYSLVTADNGYNALSELENNLDAIMRDVSLSDSSTLAGKIISGGKWYYVVPDSLGFSSKLTPGRKYELSFYENSGLTVSMKYENALTSYGKEKEYLVFSSGKLPSDFSLDRYQSASLKLTAYSGLCIPETAVRFLDGEVGVYIVDSNKARFRRISVTAKYDGVYIVDADAVNESGKTKYLALYDTVILSSKDIYDGKYIGVSS